MSSRAWHPIEPPYQCDIELLFLCITHKLIQSGAFFCPSTDMIDILIIYGSSLLFCIGSQWDKLGLDILSFIDSTDSRIQCDTLHGRKESKSYRANDLYSSIWLKRHSPKWMSLSMPNPYGLVIASNSGRAKYHRSASCPTIKPKHTRASGYHSETYRVRLLHGVKNLHTIRGSSDASCCPIE